VRASCIRSRRWDDGWCDEGERGAAGARAERGRGGGGALPRCSHRLCEVAFGERVALADCPGALRVPVYATEAEERLCPSGAEGLGRGEDERASRLRRLETKARARRPRQPSSCSPGCAISRQGTPLFPRHCTRLEARPLTLPARPRTIPLDRLVPPRLASKTSSPPRSSPPPRLACTCAPPAPPSSSRPRPARARARPAQMPKIYKPGKVALVLSGRYAGRKVVVIRQSDEGTKVRPGSAFEQSPEPWSEPAGES